ncbi:putative leucine aminopeptidase 2 [Hypsizygus marmoreus]|uniref:Peptide hydrolase n=1 Tax=Hypsizygus marmoreus TaxID=39966 RepID=A0A369JXC3_HYPMA|nr:putative leucine aminopeptidase 2 [Hypsizygus marmoreus]
MHILPAYLALLAAASIADAGILPFLPIFNKLTPAKYEASIQVKNLFGHSRKLWEFATLPGANTTRAFGTKGYNASADYVARLAKTHGYRVERQTVVYPATTIISNSLNVDGQEIPKADLTTFQYSAPASLTAPLVLVPSLGCDAANYAGLDVAGKIALVLRGNCTFVEKGALAFAAKVGGLIIHNNVPGGPVASRLNPEFALNPPTLSLSQAAAAPIVARLNAGEAIEATLNIDVINEQRASDNVIATSKSGNQNKILVVGAHLDSVPAGAGINDDGSGTATVAELAIQLSKFSGLKNAVRFAWWTTEEVGLVGSDYYVENLSATEKSKIFANINLDMTASTNYIIGIYDGDNSTGVNTGSPAPAGSGAIEKLYQKHFVKRGNNYTSYAFTSGSDYRPFLDAGIPSGGVTSGAGGLKTAQQVELFGGQLGIAFDPCYHQLCDNLNNLAADPYLWHARSSADVIAQLLTTDPKVILKEVPQTAQLKSGFDIAADIGHECHAHLDEL